MPRWIKVIVTIALLFVLFVGVDVQEMSEKLLSLSWDVLLICVLAVAGQFLACTIRWWWSLRLHGLAFSFTYLWKVYCIGFFFNSFLPSAIGGDAYRIFRTQSVTGKKLRSISAVFVERVVGLLVMLALGALGAFALAKSNGIAVTYLLLMGAGIAGCAILAGVAKAGWFRPLLARLARFAWFDALEANARYIFHWRVEWLAITVASTVFQLLAASILYVLLDAVGSTMTMAHCVLIAAAAGLASVVPISINGIGIVEGSIAGSAIALGADYEAAVLAAVALRLLMLPVNALCGLAYLFDRQPAATGAEVKLIPE